MTKVVDRVRMNTAVAIVFFNRIEPLKRLVARLAEVKPPKVYLISDGPRTNRLGEAEKVEECRDFMLQLPWNCDVKTNFSGQNLGCRVRVTSGLDWVFAQEDRAIVLEDDCVPEPEFFPWVEHMLDRYENDTRVLSIGGTNLRPQLCDESQDCAFTKYAMIWGWATWRRAWQLNDSELAQFSSACRQRLFRHWLGKWRAEWYWRYLLTHVRSSWGYRWAFTHFANHAYCVVPPVNLVENIGMADIRSTHTKDNPYDLPLTARSWQMNGKAMANVFPNQALDRWIEDNIFSRSFMNRLRWGCKKLREQMK